MKFTRSSILLAALAASATGLSAQTFTWSNTAGGSWGTDANWSSTPTFGTDVILDFSTLNIAAAAATTLDGNRTAGTLKFADATTASHDWTVNTGSSGTLTLATTSPAIPEINVTNRSAIINAVLAGSQGFTKTGSGTLVMGNNANTITGAVSVSAGTLQLGNLTATATHAFSGTGLSVASGATLSMAGTSSGTVTHTYNFGGLLGSTSDTNTANAIQLGGGTLAFSSTNATTKAFNARIHNSGNSIISYTGTSFTHSLNLNRAITGTGTLRFDWTGGGTRSVNIANLATTGTAHNFTGTVNLGTAASAVNFNLGQSLGASAYEIRGAWILNNNTSNGLNSASAITLFDAGSTLSLGSNPWVNASGTLTANNGTVSLGTGASSFATFTLSSTGTVTLNAGAGGSLTAGTSYDIRQGTLTGTGGLSGSATLTKSTTGTAIIATNNSLTGTTTISAGTLQIGNGGITGTLGSGAVTNDGTLALNRSDSTTWGNLISGSGSLSVSGGGTLTLSAANSYTGTTTVTGSSLVLSGGNNRLAATSGLAFSGTSSLNLGANNQTVASLALPTANADSSTTISGAGTLTINGASPFNFGVSGALGSSVRTASMDMTGLGGFVFNSATQLFRVGALSGVTTSGAGAPNGNFLASNNTSITASSFLLADQSGSGTGGTHTFRLGETTTLNANSINLGASGRSNATLNFNTGLTAPKITIRGSDGSSAVGTWDVGRVANFATGTWTAIADFSAGEIDARVGSLRIAITNPSGQTGRAGTQNSSFTMGKGALDVTNLVIGEHSGSGSAGNTYAANGTFTLNHADGVVTAQSIRLAENTGTVTGGTRSVSGTLNLQAGTIEAAEIRLGDQTASSPASVTRAFNFSGGTIRNIDGGDLTIRDVPVNLTGSGTRVFDASADQSITIDADSAISGSGGFTKAGAGTMIIESSSTYTGDTLVSAGTLLVSGSLGNTAVTVGSAGTIGGDGGIGGSLHLDAGAGFVFDPLTTLTVNGASVSFGGFGITNLVGFSSSVANGTYTLIYGSATFNFANVSNFGEENAYDLGGGRIAYFEAGSLNLVVVPEPASCLLGGIGALLLLRRRRF